MILEVALNFSNLVLHFTVWSEVLCTGYDFYSLVFIYVILIFRRCP